ncbi:MAG: hypothetical protein ACI9R3_003755 [Verrucomicrobiales bacterium]|jgi:hypothetical protein
MVSSVLNRCRLPVGFISGLLAIACSSSAGELKLDSPRDYQVFQRKPSGQGSIVLQGQVATVSEHAITLQSKLTTSSGDEGEWQSIAELSPGEQEFSTSIEAVGGGWYQLDIRSMQGTTNRDVINVAHVGVGEIFVIAGQSNSANHGGERQRCESGLAATFDGENWQISNDPQPGASGGGGSFVPPFADAIAQKFSVPIGIVATGVGATSVREWLPAGARFPNPPTLTGNVTELETGEWASNGKLFQKFVERLKGLGANGCRAVLWHQGESDANQRDATRTLSGKLYQQFLTQLIRESRREVGWDVPWFVAQASYHTPDDPGSDDIRAAQQAVWETNVALQGPDTDALDGELRDNDGRGVHFSGDGLRAHAAAWVEKVSPWLRQIESSAAAVPGK